MKVTENLSMSGVVAPVIDFANHVSDWRMSGSSPEKRLTGASASLELRDLWLDGWSKENAQEYSRNIENYCGTVRMPVGLAGPILVNGDHAKGSYYLPLATTEAALVASYHRGARLVSMAGGCQTVIWERSINRVAAYVFRSLKEAQEFVGWVKRHSKDLIEVAQKTTHNGTIQSIELLAEANTIFLELRLDSADAAGQNMVTFAMDAIIQFLDKVANIPVPIQRVIESNLSGDKKSSTRSLHHTRGRRVSAEALIPGRFVETILKTTVDEMVGYAGRIASPAAALIGSAGVQGHFANGLAALFIALGQDAACVAECATGIARAEKTSDGSLYVTVTLPSLLVGTVGGGTSLPAQKAGLELMNLSGSGKADALSEVVAAMVLAGELSITGAICANHFSRAHRKLSRGSLSKKVPSFSGSSHLIS